MLPSSLLHLFKTCICFLLLLYIYIYIYFFFFFFFSWLVVFWTKAISALNGHGCGFLARSVILSGHWTEVTERKDARENNQDSCARHLLSSSPVPPSWERRKCNQERKFKEVIKPTDEQWHNGYLENIFFFHFCQPQIFQRSLWINKTQS